MTGTDISPSGMSGAVGASEYIRNCPNQVGLNPASPCPVFYRPVAFRGPRVSVSESEDGDTDRVMFVAGVEVVVGYHMMSSATSLMNVYIDFRIT